MLLLGVLVNAAAAVIGGLIGLLLQKGLSERLANIITQALGLCVLYVGISGMLTDSSIIIAVLSLALGAVIGELIDIDKRIDAFGGFLRRKLHMEKEGSSFSQGFLSATLFTCVGAVGILGALNSGLQGNHDTFYFKAVVDAIFVMIMASTMGVGVCFSALPIFCYHALLTLGANALSGLLGEAVIASMSCVGSLLVVGIALNMLKITNIKVANMLPAPFFPILLHLFL